MKGYVLTKLLKYAAPLPGKEVEWVSRHVLRLPVAEPDSIDIYIHYHQMRMQGHKYLDSWNSARRDLIASLIDPPNLHGYKNRLVWKLPIKPPSREPGLWLARYVLGFTEKECRVLCRVTDLAHPTACVPLLKSAQRELRGMRIEDETLAAYHRSRSLLVRFYLDAHFHAIG